MKLLGAFILIFLSTHVGAQVISEGFDDGEFTSNPVWLGDEGQFLINPEGKLQLNADEAGQSSLYTSFDETSLANREWRVWVKQGFSGSGNNNGRIYLSALSAPETFTGTSAAGVEGYFLQLGEAGSDDAIRLFRDDDVGDSPVLVLSGSDGAIASSFELGIQVVRDASGLWQLSVDYEGGSNYSLESSGSDATYATTAFFGVICTYTVSNAEDFYFDDIFLGDPEVDDEPPVCLSAVATSSTSVTLTFNEPVNTVQVETEDNYSLVGQGSPTLATAIGMTQVELTPPTPFLSGDAQSVNVTGIEDLAGNPIDETDLEFTWVEPTTALFRDVVINEIMADPDPPVGLPNAEYVELFNSSEDFLNLEGWIFINSTTEKVLPPSSLAPGGFVILCDENEVSSFSGYGDVIGLPAFTALSNGGDSLSLKNLEGDVIDVVVYDDSWYGNPDLATGGYSLEQANPFRQCSSAQNWLASDALAGGSPGTENSIFSDVPDTQAPFIASYLITGIDEILITFSEQLDAASAVELLVELSPATDILEQVYSNQQLLLTTDLPLDFEVGYTLSITGAEDCEGNQSEPLQIEFELGYEPAPGDLLITEIMADPDEDLPSPNAEFVEIENRSDVLLSLNGLTLVDGTLTESLNLPPGGRAVLCDVDEFDQFIAFPSAVAMTGFPGLTNSGRYLDLRSGGLLLDEVTYSDDWYRDAEKDDGGYSLELINPDDPCSDGDNWQASQDATGATPGAINSVFDDSPDETGPELQWLLVNSPTELGLLFNEQIDITGLSLEGVLFSGTVGVPFSAASFQLSEENPYLLLVALDAEIPAGPTWQISVVGLADCWGNEAVELSESFAAPEPFEVGDLVINEVLFNPVTGGSDYVEVINASVKHIDLSGFYLANGEMGIPDDARLMTDLHIILPPSHILAFTADKQFQIDQYPRARPDRILQMESLPSYTNDAGWVFLLDPLQQVGDAMSYSEDQQFALLDVVDGVSLERIDPLRESTDETNWHSASEAAGFGTPGAINSQLAIWSVSELELSISPEVFSPDNDGFEDVTTIGYTLEDAGWVANISIFDHEGRLMKTLVQNELLGTQGAFSWDGTRDDRQKARMGMYIVVVELFDLDGNLRTEKRTVALAHRLN